MKTFLLISIALIFTTDAFSYTVPVRRDLKPASQQMIEKREIADAVVADADRILAAQATSDSVITTVSSFLAQPDVCRAVSITPGGTTASVPGADVVVSGTNVFGQSISEDITIAENGSSAVQGTKAFCTVSSIVFPIQDGAGATYDVGVNDVLGLHRCMDAAGHVIFSVFDGAYESTRATCVADADEVEKNTCNIDGTLDGSKDVEIFFIQNFACLP